MNRSSPRRRSRPPTLYTHGRDVVLLRREGSERLPLQAHRLSKSMIEKEVAGQRMTSAPEITPVKRPPTSRLRTTSRGEKRSTKSLQSLNKQKGY